MKPARATVSLLALLVASACASSQAEPNRPAASPPAPVASPSYDGTDQPVIARGPRLAGSSSRLLALRSRALERRLSLASHVLLER